MRRALGVFRPRSLRWDWQSRKKLVAFAEKGDEAVPGADCARVLLRQLDHRGVGARASHQAFAGGFAESDAEPDSRHRADQSFLDVLDGFEEMRLTEDKIRRVWLVDFDRSELHVDLLC